MCRGDVKIGVGLKAPDAAATVAGRRTEQQVRWVHIRGTTTTAESWRHNGLFRVPDPKMLVHLFQLVGRWRYQTKATVSFEISRGALIATYY